MLSINLSGSKAKQANMSLLEVEVPFDLEVCTGEPQTMRPRTSPMRYDWWTAWMCCPRPALSGSKEEAPIGPQ